MLWPQVKKNFPQNVADVAKILLFNITSSGLITERHKIGGMSRELVRMAWTYTEKEPVTGEKRVSLLQEPIY